MCAVPARILQLPAQHKIRTWIIRPVQYGKVRRIGYQILRYIMVHENQIHTAKSQEISPKPNLFSIPNVRGNDREPNRSQNHC